MATPWYFRPMWVMVSLGSLISYYVALSYPRAYFTAFLCLFVGVRWIAILPAVVSLIVLCPLVLPVLLCYHRWIHPGDSTGVFLATCSFGVLVQTARFLLTSNHVIDVMRVAWQQQQQQPSNCNKNKENPSLKSEFDRFAPDLVLPSFPAKDGLLEPKVAPSHFLPSPFYRFYENWSESRSASFEELPYDQNWLQFPLILGGRDFLTPYHLLDREYIPFFRALRAGCPIQDGATFELVQKILLEQGIVTDTRESPREHGKLAPSGFARISGLFSGCPIFLAGLKQYYEGQWALSHHSENPEGFRGVFNDAIAIGLTRALTPYVEKIFEVRGHLRPVRPLLLWYKKGSLLSLHTDDTKFAYSVSITISCSSEEPIYVITSEGLDSACHHEGDAIAFLGRQVPHFRNIVGMRLISLSLGWQIQQDAAHS